MSLLEVKYFVCMDIPTNDDIRHALFMVLSHGCVVNLNFPIYGRDVDINIYPGSTFEQCKSAIDAVVEKHKTVFGGD